MTRRLQVTGASVALFALAVGVVFTLLQMCFDVWMTAYPFANTSEWRTRLYVRLATFIVIGVLWSILVAWLLRHRRNG